MGMDVAPNPNPPDIRISIYIHGFTHYVHNHNNIEPFRPFINNYMDTGGEGEWWSGRFDCLVCLVGSE
jgi:hypothetical protein